MGVDRLRLLQGEIESAFATENGAHSFADIRAVDPMFQRGQVSHEIREAQQRVTQYAGIVPGRQSTSRLTFGASLRGDGVALDTVATPAEDTLQGLLKLCLGGSDASGAGSTVNGAGATTTVIPVQVGHGARFDAGKAVMIGGEISVIESIAGDSLTLKHALSSPPADATAVYNSYTAYIDPSASATWQFNALCEDTVENWTILGCVGPVTFANLLQYDNTLPLCMFDLFVTAWVAAGETLAAGSYDGGDFLGTAEAMEIILEDHGTPTRTCIACDVLEIDPAVGWLQSTARGNGDVQHVDRYKITSVGTSVRLSVDPASGYEADYTSQTDRALLVCFGTTPGRSWALEVPKCRMTGRPGPGSHADQRKQVLSLRGGEDDCGAATSALERSNFRIHRL